MHVSEPPLTIQPIYADRASAQTFPDARAMVNAYLTRFGERAGAKLELLDASGYTLVRKGSASVGINVLEDHGVLLFVAPVMPVPITGRETFYRRLLELSFLIATERFDRKAPQVIASDTDFRNNLSRGIGDRRAIEQGRMAFE